MANGIFKKLKYFEDPEKYGKISKSFEGPFDLFGVLEIRFRLCYTVGCTIALILLMALPNCHGLAMSSEGSYDYMLT